MEVFVFLEMEIHFLDFDFEVWKLFLIFGLNTNKIWIFDFEIPACLLNKSELNGFLWALWLFRPFLASQSAVFACQPFDGATLCSINDGSLENEVRIKIVLSKEQIWLRPKSEFNFN